MPHDAFEQGMRLSKRSFDLGLFDAAYHYLAGALYIADCERSERGMIEVETAAIDQLSYIDRHHPEYHHSTKSSTHRNYVSIFRILARQASTKQVLLQLREVPHTQPMYERYGEAHNATES